MSCKSNTELLTLLPTLYAPVRPSVPSVDNSSEVWLVWCYKRGRLQQISIHWIHRVHQCSKTLNKKHVNGLSNQMERRCGGVRDRILGINSVVHGSGLRLSITVGRCVPAVICLQSRGWRDNWREVTEHGCECWLPTLSSTGRSVGDAGGCVSGSCCDGARDCGVRCTSSDWTGCCRVIILVRRPPSGRR